MSPFEAGRKLLSMESARLSLGERLDLVFQDAGPGAPADPGRAQAY